MQLLARKTATENREDLQPRGVLRGGFPVKLKSTRRVMNVR